MIKDLSCDAFDSKECLTPGSPVSSLDVRSRSPVFASAAVFDRTARESTRPVLPHPVKKPQQRETVAKALMRFQSHIKHGKKSGQICLDDDVLTEDEPELKALKKVIEQLFEGLLPESSSFEK
ncbi:hypothetical protein SLS59_004856 [Nothophoma quercina]|uniref:Uncharacterized protein n=1 Tax=Nothophoma quercina TaxID=749835 RepID=A0ABR3RCM2_9PLEO